MAKSATPVKQPQDDDMSTNQPTTSLGNALNLLPPNQTAWFLSLVAVIFALSHLALTVPSCEGSLLLKGWGVEYQLTKKGNCSPSPETTQK